MQNHLSHQPEIAPQHEVVEEPSEPTTVKGQPLPNDTGAATKLDPTRYGDWEKNGRCIDF